MKKLLKQKLLWIAMLCIIVAIAMAITDSITHPTNSLTSKLQSGINSGKAATLNSCCTPEYAEDLIEGLSYSSDYYASILGANYKFIILGDSTRSTDLEDYSGEIPCIMILQASNGTVYEASCVTFLTEEVNGKDYIGGEAY